MDGKDGYKCGRREECKSWMERRNEEEGGGRDARAGWKVWKRRLRREEGIYSKSAMERKDREKKVVMKDHTNTFGMRME